MLGLQVNNTTSDFQKIEKILILGIGCHSICVWEGWPEDISFSSLGSKSGHWALWEEMEQQSSSCLVTLYLGFSCGDSRTQFPIYEGWECGSIGRMLAYDVQSPGFHPRHHTTQAWWGSLSFPFSKSQSRRTWSSRPSSGMQ